MQACPQETFIRQKKTNRWKCTVVGLQSSICSERANKYLHCTQADHWFFNGITVQEISGKTSILVFWHYENTVCSKIMRRWDEEAGGSPLNCAIFEERCGNAFSLSLSLWQWLFLTVILTGNHLKHIQLPHNFHLKICSSAIGITD